MKWQILISVLLGAAVAGVGAMVAWEMSINQPDVANRVPFHPERNASQLPSTPPEIAPLKPEGDELYPVEGTPYLARWKSIDDFESPLAVFDTVFWEPQDTISLRVLIRETRLVQGNTILEIGTGSGLVALCCVQAGADRVLATDINPAAVACARFNARRLELSERFEVRQVSESDSGAFAVIRPGERFDLIISNPPWEDEAPKTIGEYALYDRHFSLMKSLVAGLRHHLAPGGKALLAYGSVTAIRTLLNLCDAENLYVRLLDKRDLDTLPEVFLPGMLVEVRTDESARDPAPRSKGRF